LEEIFHIKFANGRKEKKGRKTGVQNAKYWTSYEDRKEKLLWERDPLYFKKSGGGSKKKRLGAFRRTAPSCKIIGLRASNQLIKKQGGKGPSEEDDWAARDSR